MSYLLYSSKTCNHPRFTSAGVLSFSFLFFLLLGFTPFAFAETVQDEVKVFVRPNVTCTGTPSVVGLSQPVLWKAEVQPATASYRYAWSGTDSLSGNESSIGTSYSTVGDKSATVTVTPTDITTPDLSNSASCTITVGGPDLTSLITIKGTAPVPNESYTFYEGVKSNGEPETITLGGAIQNFHGVVGTGQSFENRFSYRVGEQGAWYPVFSFGLPALQAGASATAQEYTLSPTGTVSGQTWTFKLCADATNQVSEQSKDHNAEADNCVEQAVVIKSRGDTGLSGTCFASPPEGYLGNTFIWTVDPDEKSGSAPYTIEWIGDTELVTACTRSGSCFDQPNDGTPYVFDMLYETSGSKNGKVRITDARGGSVDISCFPTATVEEEISCDSGQTDFTLATTPPDPLGPILYMEPGATVSDSATVYANTPACFSETITLRANIDGSPSGVQNGGILVLSSAPTKPPQVIYRSTKDSLNEKTYATGVIVSVQKTNPAIPDGTYSFSVCGTSESGLTRCAPIQLQVGGIPPAGKKGALPRPRFEEF